ncbi:MAG TPA: hypothetical protein VMR95_01470 [Candidatus Binatia bacterium]|nr:hypothetical protein [Candidatus Binatia bacterium]
MVVVRRLVWDSWNTDHLVHHAVTPDEVDQICKSDPLVQQGKKGRLVISGKTLAGRFLVVILDPETELDTYYPVTAYPASGKYRRIYEQEKGEKTL